MSSEFSSGCGCFALILSVLIGAPLALIGFQNFNIRNTNPEIKKVALKDLVTSQPETPLWVEVSGLPVDGSYVNVPGSALGYMLVRDPQDKIAVYVALGTASPLSSKNGEPLVIRGMIAKVSEGMLVPEKLLVQNVLPDVEVTPLLVEKDNSPPGWFASWGLIMLSAAIFGVTASTIQRWRR